MAFNQPLEADNVGDNNLLVSIVTGPILGTLMWIIGDDERKKEDALQQGLQDMILDDNDTDNDNHIMAKSGAFADGFKQDRQLQQQHGNLPRLATSDVSVAAEGGPQQGFPRSYGETSLYGTSSTSSDGKEKKLSWSDNLVQYMDESAKREPSSVSGDASSSAKPIKSAMTRSSSVRSHSLAGEMAATGEEKKLRYLPRGLDKPHNGLIMPGRPMMGGGHPSDSHSTGLESPQWGWYANLTPPSPEMYQSRGSLREKSDESTASVTSMASGASQQNKAQHYQHHHKPNKIFQTLASSNRAPMGWAPVGL